MNKNLIKLNENVYLVVKENGEVKVLTSKASFEEMQLILEIENTIKVLEQKLNEENYKKTRIESEQSSIKTTLKIGILGSPAGALLSYLIGGINPLIGALMWFLTSIVLSIGLSSGKSRKQRQKEHTKAKFNAGEYEAAISKYKKQLTKLFEKFEVEEIKQDKLAVAAIKPIDRSLESQMEKKTTTLARILS